jgi:hypothetical protein
MRARQMDSLTGRPMDQWTNKQTDRQTEWCQRLFECSAQAK